MNHLLHMQQRRVQNYKYVRMNDSQREVSQMPIGFYKSSRFRRDACIKVSVEKENVVDYGGIRWQLYLSVYEAISKGQLQIFEGLST